MDDLPPARESRSGPTLSCSTDAVILREPRSLSTYAREDGAGARISVTLPPAAVPLRITPLPAPTSRPMRRVTQDASGTDAPPRLVLAPQGASVDVWQISIAFAFGVVGASLAGLLGPSADLAVAIVASFFAGCTSLVAAGLRAERASRAAGASRSKRHPPAPPRSLRDPSM